MTAQIPNLAGSALTVRGPVDPSALGVVSMHEHIFIDITRPPHNPRPGYDQPAAHDPLTLENLADVRAGAASIANDQLGSFEEQLAEILLFRDAGGSTLVEVSNEGLGRDAVSLSRASIASGLHLVMGAGWYEKNFHPADMDERTVDDLTSVIVRDVVEGVDGTGIRAGIIGEVGVEGAPLTDNELKSTRASGRASRITGAPITFHRGGTGEEQHTVLDVLEDEGVDLRRVTMGHAGGIGHDLPFARRLLARGVFVEYDFLGTTGSPWGTLWPMTDRSAAEGIVALVDAGYADQIVLGHDVCQKVQLKRYGGHGYTYLLDHFLPALSDLGLPDEVLHGFMTGNAHRALTFGAPQ
ncbi:MAG: aryldialkylphosphatase [Actinobacteria bacterium]|nr:aryldialkylphosphatase [Actinomycetota bacterium]